jgi:hypothetical protein
MCCTAGPAQLENTIIYAGHATREGQRVQVLAYQNKAQSFAANAMILPIPTDVSMGPENMVDTREGGWFLETLRESLRPRTARRFSKGLIGAAALNDSFQVFESGSYTVVLADRLSLVRSALAQVPEHKRPEFSSEFLVGYGKLYPNHKFVVCCWAGELKAEPMMLWFVPRDEQLFIPTMDAHDGGAPRPGLVKTDHAIVVGTTAVQETGMAVDTMWRFETLPDTIKSLLAPRAFLHTPPARAQNGDTWAEHGKISRVALQ